MKNIFKSLLITFFALTIAFTPKPTLAIEADSLVKCKDFPSVYYVGGDGKRYVFPNEKVYFSWYEDFSDVKSITCIDLSKMPIGGHVHYQAGTRLIKIPSAPSVYAVEFDGTLRKIKTQEQAIELYGTDWARRVDDISESFFTQYTIGEDLGPQEIPQGSFILDENGEYYRFREDTSININNIEELKKSLISKHALKFENLEKSFDHKFHVWQENEVQTGVIDLLRDQLKIKNFGNNTVEEYPLAEILEVGLEFPTYVFFDKADAYLKNRQEIIEGFNTYANREMEETDSNYGFWATNNNETEVTEISFNPTVIGTLSEYLPSFELEEFWGNVLLTNQNLSGVILPTSSEAGAIVVTNGLVQLVEGRETIAEYNFNQDVQRRIQEVSDFPVEYPSQEKISEACESGAVSIEGVKIFSKCHDLIGTQIINGEEITTKSRYCISSHKIKGYDCERQEYYSHLSTIFVASEYENGKRISRETGSSIIPIE